MIETEGKGKCWKPPPELTPAVARQILRKSVATIMAHLGYEGEILALRTSFFTNITRKVVDIVFSN